MVELKIHLEGAEGDPSGKKMGVLAVVTILSHRAHTDAVRQGPAPGPRYADRTERSASGLKRKPKRSSARTWPPPAIGLEHILT